MFKNAVVLFIGISLLVLSGIFVWMSTLEIPTLDGFESRQIKQSTKIYDRTGKVLLFDIHGDVQRTVVPFDKISKNLKNASIAIEDSEFYSHHGIKPKSILRAVLVNLKSGSYSQGGSTITQQVVKNTLLTKDKKISRKIKEWILAIKLEKILTKDEILNLYLNEVPYGGNIYGAEEAAQHFFGVSANDLTLAQSAYMAALPQAPTKYSPYGNHRDLLEKRKNLVLKRMLELGFISDADYKNALKEKVTFEQYGDTNIKAPHFVFYIREYLEEKYGKDAVYNGGLKVITSLNYDLQKKAEEVVNKYAHSNEKNFNAKNAALVAIDPKTGQVLTMVGSRDYFDTEIDGKFNIATAKRQPGSTFKPIVYVSAFEKGYTPETVVFDVPTQFSSSCTPNNITMENGCYAPANYDNKFRGPITFRNALAQSINVPAIKAIYLVGIQNVLNKARALGITSLTESASHYGLPLALGGGEVSPLELTSVYATFANDGVKQPISPILKITDASGTVLEEYKQQEGTRIITLQAVRQLQNVMTDAKAREPEYGRNSFYFGDQKVAVKTGTTNEYRDVWVMGYTPYISVGTWGGNNDNSPIVKKIAGFVLAPMWREFMDYALTVVPHQNFTDPEPEKNPSLIKPILNGIWQSPQGVHNILHFVNKDNPRGPLPTHPESDPQYDNWEFGVQNWLRLNNNGSISNSSFINENSFSFISPYENTNYKPGSTIPITIQTTIPNIKSINYYLNGLFIGSVDTPPYSFSVISSEIGLKNLKGVITTKNNKIYTTTRLFSIK